MSSPDFDHFCALIRSRSGLVLNAEKDYLVSGRLGPIARAEGCKSVAELLGRLRTQPNDALIARCVEAMATYESSFFRDTGAFEQLAGTIIPQLIERRAAVKTLRIWCAACSSGQEPYSVAILLQEMTAKMPGWRIEILATDMSGLILEKAKSGVYSEFEIKRGLTPERLRRWFTQQNGLWQLAPTIQQMVSFRPHNLLQGTPGMGPFDLILCRNVLIYFDVQQKGKALGDLARVLAPDGHLMLGCAETVIGVTDTLELTPGSRGLYRRRRISPVRVAAQ